MQFCVVLKSFYLFQCKVYLYISPTYSYSDQYPFHSDLQLFNYLAAKSLGGAEVTLATAEQKDRGSSPVRGIVRSNCYCAAHLNDHGFNNAPTEM